MSEPRRSKSFLQTLYFRVLVGIVAGVIIGRFFPSFGASLKPLGDGFLKLIRMLVAPVVFFTVVTGIAKFGDLHAAGAGLVSSRCSTSSRSPRLLSSSAWSQRH